MKASDLPACFTDTLGRFAGSIRLDAACPQVTGADLRDPAILQDLIDRFAATVPGGDMRAVVSMWSQWHFSNVIVPAVVARLLCGVTLPVALASGRFALNANGCTAGVLLSGDAPLAAAAESAGFTELLDGHLVPLIGLVAAHCGVSAKLLWSNAAVSMAWTVQQCAGRTGVDQQSLALANEILASPSTPSGARNPLMGALKPSSLAPIESCQRRICCLRYLLPGMADCGSFCPQPAKARAAPRTPPGSAAAH